MGVYNVHRRHFAVSPEKAGELIDSWSGEGDPLRTEGWPPTLFDRPLGIGADGGHGPVRYTVIDYVPGHLVRCRFNVPRGFHGWHEFAVHTEHGGATLVHTLAMRLRGPGRLSWPLVFRRLHDAMLEDTLDRAEHELTGTVRSPARWSAYVRSLRRLLRVLGLAGRGQRSG